MTDRIEALARECADEWVPRGREPHADYDYVGELADLIATKLRAYLRPEGGVPVRCKAAWLHRSRPGGVDHVICADTWEPNSLADWLRVDTITAYLVPPQPEAGHEAEGVADG